MFKFFKIYIVFFLIVQSDSFSENISYLINTDFKGQDSIAINLTINCENYHKSFIFSDDATIKELKINNKETKDFTLRNDSLILRYSTKKIFLKYLLSKSQYALDSHTIILKKEGKWYPSIQNTVINATISIQNAEQYYIISGKNCNNNLFKFESQPSLFVFLLPNNKFQKIEMDTLKTKIFFYESDQCPFKHDNKFKTEFFKSIKFYSDLFKNRPFETYKVISIPDKNFQICQSFTSGLIFGQDYFYNLYKMNRFTSWIPHEVAHQWWSFSILSDVNSSFYRFFEESITEFLKVIYVKENYGDSTYNKLIKNYINMFNYVIKDTTDVPISKIFSLNSQVNSIIIYCKGPLILNKYVLHCSKGFKGYEMFLPLFYNKYKNHLVNFNLFNKEISKYCKEEPFNLVNLLYLKGKCWE